MFYCYPSPSLVSWACEPFCCVLPFQESLRFGVIRLEIHSSRYSKNGDILRWVEGAPGGGKPPSWHHPDTTLNEQKTEYMSLDGDEDLAWGEDGEGGAGRREEKSWSCIVVQVIVDTTCWIDLWVIIVFTDSKFRSPYCIIQSNQMQSLTILLRIYCLPLCSPSSEGSGIVVREEFHEDNVSLARHPWG